MYIECVQVCLSWVCFVFVRSGNNILQTQLVGSQGIVGNWKSRWICMSFQEETVTTEIATKHKGYNFNIAHLRLSTSLIHLLFLLYSFSPWFLPSSLGLSHLLSSIIHSVDLWMTLAETGNCVQLAKDLSGWIHGDQSPKYVQKEQPVIMSNTRHIQTHN